MTIMVALNCEAKPLVDLYGLKKVNASPFARYAADHHDTEIVITGIGGIAMATAVGWVRVMQYVQSVTLFVCTALQTLSEVERIIHL